MKQNRKYHWGIVGVFAIVIISSGLFAFHQLSQKNHSVPTKNILSYIPENDSLVLFELQGNEAIQTLDRNAIIRSWLRHTDYEPDIFLRMAKKMEEINPEGKLILGIYRPGTSNARIILWGNISPRQSKEIEKWIKKYIASDFVPEKERLDSLILTHYTITGNRFLSCMEGNGIFGASNDYKLLRASARSSRSENQETTIESKNISPSQYVHINSDLLPGSRYLKIPHKKIVFETVFDKNKIWNTGYIPYVNDSSIISRLQHQSKNQPFNPEAFGIRTILGMQYQIPDIETFFTKAELHSADSILLNEIDNEINVAWVNVGDYKLSKIISMRLKEPQQFDRFSFPTRLSFMPEPLCNDSVYQETLHGDYLFLSDNRSALDDYIHDIETGETITKKPSFTDLNKHINDRINWIFFGIDIPDSIYIRESGLYSQFSFFTELGTGLPNAIFCNLLITGK